MRINKIISVQANHPGKPPSQDFIDYCTDLHALSPGYLDIMTKPGFSFSALLDNLMVRADVLSILKNSDCCAMVYSTYDYDPFFSDPATYLMDRYHLTCDMFDVIDQGDL